MTGLPVPVPGLPRAPVPVLGRRLLVTGGQPFEGREGWRTGVRRHDDTTIAHERVFDFRG